MLTLSALVAVQILAGSPAATSSALLDGRRIDLRPMPIVSTHARFVRGTPHGDVPIAPPTIEVLRGSDDDRLLVFSNADGQVSGVCTRDGVMHRLVVDHADGLRLRTGDPVDMITPADAAEACGFTGLTPNLVPAHRTPGDTRVGIAAPAAGPRVASIAIDADQAYVNRFGGDEDAALSAIVATIASVSDIYERDLGIRLELTLTRLWTDGGEPFDSASLASFRSWWIDAHDPENYRFVHLMTGRRDTPFGGIAYLATACNDDAFGISAFLAGNAAPPDAPPSLEWWDTNVIAHEMGHNLGTLHTHDGYEPTIDDCGNSVSAPRGTIMSYCHLHPGGVLNLDLRLHARVQDYILEANPPGDCLYHDCNSNGIDDAQDLLSGWSDDVDADGIPDECRDCNGNGVLDTVDLADGTSNDVDGDLRPDECQPDCNENALPDAYEIIEFGVEDYNGNNRPDECEPDCDGNGVLDFADIETDSDLDLDRNGVLDACEDCNGDTEPDWRTAGGSGNYIVAGDGEIREFLASSGVLVAQYGTGLVVDPMDVCIDPAGMLWACDASTGEVMRFALADPVPELVISTGGEPRGIVVTEDGRVLAADRALSQVRQFSSTTGEELDPLVNTGPTGVFGPVDLIIDGDRLLVSTHGQQVRAFDIQSGELLDTLVNDSGVLGADGLAVLDGGDLVVASPDRGVVWRFDAQTGDSMGSFLDEYPLNTPTDILVHTPERIFVPKANVAMARIVEYDAPRRYVRSMVRGYPTMTAPQSVVIRPAGPGDCDGNGRPDDCDIADGGDADGDGILDACQCPGDIDGDGQVDVDEVLVIIAAWGQSGHVADIDGSGTVDTGDLLLVLELWGSC